MPLYLVATPIGNLEDISLRALRILKEADLIACEDTRHSGRLLSHYGIDRPTASYHEHNESDRVPEFLSILQSGRSIAVITDAGTPGISDPSFRIVTAAIANGIEVIPIPGPAALIAGVIASGLPTNAFFFGGFLPPKQKARKERLEELRGLNSTLIFYEAPHRLRETLLDLEDVLGDRKAAAARELTKLHEQFVRGTISELKRYFDSTEPRGEFVLIVDGRTDVEVLDSSAPASVQLASLIEQTGLERSEAIKRLAEMKGLTRKELYRKLLEEKDGD